jgi:hypothetical protein
MFEALRRRRREAVEDKAYAWLELREAGAIDPDAPWPFGAVFDPPLPGAKEGQS